MQSALILGSGPAAAGAALALSAKDGVKITVLDVGVRLEADKQAMVDDLPAAPRQSWAQTAIEAISAQPVVPTIDVHPQHPTDALPQKRTYGSDFPFRDVGQLTGVTAHGRANGAVISGAYGGFSNVWGAQVMPFTSASFDTWPVSWSHMEPHYRSVLSHMPFAAQDDDLAALFPLLADASPLPTLAPRSAMVLDAYASNRDHIRRLGITMGRARLAFDPLRCVRCGMCMTGCPYSLIYSASQTFDDLRRQSRVDYHGDVVAFRVGEDVDGPFVLARGRTNREQHCFRADRVFVACGAVGTTRLVLGSMDRPPATVTLAESVQFVLPTVSRRPTPDPRNRNEFTLNQFNMIVSLDDRGLDVTQVHFYPFNPAYLQALPALLATRPAQPVTSQLLRRLTVGLGYLPSWASPRVRLAVTRPTGTDLPGLVVSQDDWPRPPMLGEVLRRIWRAAPRLDLWPVTPRLIVSGGAKSYHFGGSFPHRQVGARPGPAPTTDRLGRLAEWKRVHLVDASVFPSVPATTFTLTIMANAHRIAQESMELADDR
ncbi:MAG TPA: GMC oxidoreductase [Acidimicrobiales bacterium]|nr:GMC oxidoreductase [Acidimicrobiales bacterium]